MLENEKVPCQHIYDLWLSVAAVVELLFASESKAVCVWQENTCTIANMCFIFCMIFCFTTLWSSVFPPPCDLWPLPWSLKRSSLCSSCEHCHCHTGSLPFIVSTRKPVITLLQVASPVVTQKHTVTIHTCMCAMLWFMLSAVETDAQLFFQILLCTGLSSFLDCVTQISSYARPMIHTV